MIRERRTISDTPYLPPPLPYVGRQRPKEEEEEEEGENTSDHIAYCRHWIYLIASTTFIIYIPICAS